MIFPKGICMLEEHKSSQGKIISIKASIFFKHNTLHQPNLPTFEEIETYDEKETEKGNWTHILPKYFRYQ